MIGVEVLFEPMSAELGKIVYLICLIILGLGFVLGYLVKSYRDKLSKKSMED